MEIGDILFVDSNNKNTKFKTKFFRAVNLTFQPILCKKKYDYKNLGFHFTHVILSLGKGLFIEAIPSKGVQIFTLQKLIDDFKYEYSDDFKVFRNKVLTEEQKEKIFKSAEYYLFESYNINFLNNKNKKEGKSYCSELIKNVYEKVGITLSDSYKALPIDLYKFMLYDDNWNEDALDNYKSKINSKNSLEISLSNIYFELFYMNQLMNTLIRGTNRITNSFKNLPESGYNCIHCEPSNLQLDIHQIDNSYLEKEKDNKNINKNDIFSSLICLINHIKDIDNDDYLKKLNNDNLITHWQDKINLEMAKALVKKDKEEKKRLLIEGIDNLVEFSTQLIKIFEIYKTGKFKKKYWIKFDNIITYLKNNFPDSIDIEAERIKFNKILDDENCEKIIFSMKCINYINKFNFDNLSKPIIKV